MTGICSATDTKACAHKLVSTPVSCEKRYRWHCRSGSGSHLQDNLYLLQGFQNTDKLSVAIPSPMSSNNAAERPTYGLARSTSDSITSSSTSEMHDKITKQMRIQQDRWSTWQAKQIVLFQEAASAPESEGSFRKRITAKRPHLHLDKVSSTLRKLRG